MIVLGLLMFSCLVLLLMRNVFLMGIEFVVGFMSFWVMLVIVLNWVLNVLFEFVGLSLIFVMSV